ncbi:hypothetical protein Q1695_006011 [Nippostrongylus brasiliensis]|nr:hypothetical protein Q1695_006011 [Nippostrongylus brasiliensis]
MLALIDTGAGITVASQALLSLLGVFELQPSAIPSAIGMADPHPPKELVVRSAQTIVLPPGTETLVPCYVAQVPPSNPPLIASASVLDEDNIFVAPAVFFNDKARLLVSNPSSAARVIYRNQRLSEATLLHEASGTLSDDEPCF